MLGLNALPDGDEPIYEALRNHPEWVHDLEWGVPCKDCGILLLDSDQGYDLRKLLRILRSIENPVSVCILRSKTRHRNETLDSICSVSNRDFEHTVAHWRQQCTVIKDSLSGSSSNSSSGSSSNCCNSSVSSSSSSSSNSSSSSSRSSVSNRRSSSGMRTRSSSNSSSSIRYIEDSSTGTPGQVNTAAPVQQGTTLTLSRSAVRKQFEKPWCVYADARPLTCPGGVNTASMHGSNLVLCNCDLLSKGAYCSCSAGFGACLLVSCLLFFCSVLGV